VICVEPVDDFYNLLIENISAMDSEYRDRIRTVKAFVGISEGQNHKYEIVDGTAHMVPIKNTGDIPTYTLSHIIEANKLNKRDIDLIKVDTDGYDAECIISLGEEIYDINPPLFWENLIENEEQYRSHNDLINYLSDNGYQNYYIFDNFGSFLLKTDQEGVKCINDYILRFRKNKSAKTFYYVDILAVKGNVKEYEKLIQNYLKQYG